ncbi:Gfo/Idh/MocA family protein [Bythopirellula polymerisocia]|uniref:4-carboxy-2-hydroxymuconate-6-semialdehyde dehydrogenase n=1 Tax=Bythopirellula polymerisocia TaxID=2528003 RepID=A0A5C6D0K1_9BACT|nr:Gfo/Idh/MocA family oxidoreductase [Bythopirellula polymerisocia]TWU28706.1 4-carboxy-2-hydroxymuconate-6-semialdehyde dehydrogenase [Bythopirellula polymerisocia]
MKPLTGVCVGAGYFASFHLDAWVRLRDVRIVGVCDRDNSRVVAALAQLDSAQPFSDLAQALEETQPDFVDIITPPESHLALVQACSGHVSAAICQKPLAPDFSTAVEIVETARNAGLRLMVHENFRFQPWYREIKRLLKAGVVGRQVHQIAFRMRMGDGWHEDAYLERQPYFRKMPRLLLHETGVHLIDVFRFLAGEIVDVHAYLCRLNQVIVGEDAGVVACRFKSGALGILDANRYNEPNYPNPRLTFGELTMDCDDGTIRLYGDGRITLQQLGSEEEPHHYSFSDAGFAGDCVYSTQAHFVDCLRNDREFETDASDYLRTLEIVERAYETAGPIASAPVSPGDAVERE